MSNKIAIRRVVLAAGVILFSASFCRADFTAGFEAPDYAGNDAGMLASGQQSWYLPAVSPSTDAYVYAYVGNFLGLSANPTGGEQFIGGRPSTGAAALCRAQHDVDFSGAPLYDIQYDFNAKFDTTLGLAAANNIGSFSLLAPPTTSPPASQGHISLRQWKPGAEGQLYQLVYIVYNAAGTETRMLMLDNMVLDRWYREETFVDFASHRVVGVLVTDLATSAQTALTPTEWYLGGGAAGATPIPGAVRFFTGGNEANIMAWDNLSIEQVPEATPVVWNGGASGDDRWTSAANWGGTAPAAGQHLQFGALAPGGHASNQNNFPAGTQFNGITFLSGAPACNLQGNAILLGGPVTNESGNNQTITTALQMKFFVAGSFDTGIKDMTVSGVVSGTGPLIKSGTGTLTLRGANSYTCGTNINGGTVQVSSDGNLGEGSGPVTLDGGTLKTVTTGITSARSVTLNAGGGTFDTNGLDSTLSGPISGAGGLTKNGAGQLLLSGVNSYTGGTTVNGGTLQGSAASIRGAVKVANSSKVVFDQVEDGIFGGGVAGAGSLAKTGSGLLTLTSASTYSGPTLINGGTLQVGVAGTVPGDAAGRYSFDNVSGSTVINEGLLAGKNGTLANAVITAGGIQGNSMSLLDNNGMMKIDNGTNDNSGVALPGGVYTASAWFNNVYSGSIHRTLLRGSDVGGTGDHLVIVNNDGTGNPLGFWGNAAGGGFVGCGFPMTPYVGDTSWHQITVVANGATSTYYIDGQQVGSPVAKVSTMNVWSVGNYITGTQPFAQQIDEVYLYQRAFTPEEVLDFYWGTQQAPGGDINAIPDGSAVTLNNSAVLAIKTVGETIGSLTGGAGTTVDLGAGTLTTGDGTSTTFSGTISGDGGSLVKQGSGKFAISGHNTYTGGTTVTGGTLVIGGVLALPAGRKVTIDRGATLVLQSGLAANGMSAAAVPEPSTLALLGISGLGLLGCGWRRRNKSLAANPF